jgi:hypothetical protein
MKDPLSALWAGMIADMERKNRFVYVEIDEESQAITNVLIPRVFKVESLERDEREDVIVMLMPSAAGHFLLKADPNFESMLTFLQKSLDDNSEVLLTETRDEHEIIDVRPPSEPSGDSTDPWPTPPDDPPVSVARSEELYNDMNLESCIPCNPSSDCIPFLYPDDGCWIRAHKMCYMMIADDEDPEKVWINFGGLKYIPTVNHPDCATGWGWHVAPTLTIDATDSPKFVIDPSVSPYPESDTDWRDRQGYPDATLTHSDWTHYNTSGGAGATLEYTNTALGEYRDKLLVRCTLHGPPPYSCVRNLFVVIDRNTFSEHEIAAMLEASNPDPAEIDAAFYVVADGYSPYELGFTAPEMQIVPEITISPGIGGMTISVDRLEFEHPTHLNRRQRLTWVCKISFSDTSGFTGERVIATFEITVSNSSLYSGNIYLIKQPNPYEIDGPTSWLSTDLRVFQIDSGASKFGVDMDSDPSDFIKNVISNLNTGSTGGQTFENDISTDQQTSRLELSRRVDGDNVYNFAIAKVRYLASLYPANSVRVFFRLFPVATTSLEYDLATTYRQHISGARVVPLLGIKNNQIVGIPCFAEPRIESSEDSMIEQRDPANVQTIPANSGGEVVRYFGCWLDINQTQPQFPINPSSDGPYTSGRKSIQELIRNAHQCLVSEIAFTPSPARGGSTPSTSDKLAQRNLAIVASPNPGVISSRRIPQTFEIRPSLSKAEPDELMIDWGNVPEGSYATIHIPGIESNDILLMSAKKYRSHGLVRIDKHTVKCDACGITYLPIPFIDANLAGMITVTLSEGITKGQVFTIVVRQITDMQGGGHKSPIVADSPRSILRHVVGSFQITIPVMEKTAMLAPEQRLLSNLRWIETAIPSNDRWFGVFGKYVKEIAGRVDALGGNSDKVAASPSGQWREAYKRCLLLSIIIFMLIVILLVGIGVSDNVAMTGVDVLIFGLLIMTVKLWIKKCRPKICKMLRLLLAGAGVSTIILGLLAVLGVSTPLLLAMLITSAVLTVSTAILSWVKGCFK